MPIFEYHCNDCDKDFDTLLAHDESATQCRHCSSENIRKKFSCFSTRTDSYTASDVSASSTSGCAGCTASSCASCSG